MSPEDTSGSPQPRVIVITGANRGIGFCLARRLLTDAIESAAAVVDPGRHAPSLILCLCCRNLTAARAAAELLRDLAATAGDGCSSNGWCRIDTCQLDTSDFDSVRACTRWLAERYTRVDMLYLNAGILLVSHVDWLYMATHALTREAWTMFTTGLGILVQADFDCPDGRRGVFKTNVAGHFLLLIGLLEESRLLGPHPGSGRPSRVVWTSSCNASRRHFSLDDLECRRSAAPYAAGKYAIDLLCPHLNRRYGASRGVEFFPVDPGLVITNLAEGIVPLWFWYLAWPVLCLLRLLVTSYSLTPENGVHALARVAQPAEVLRPDCKYFSRTGVLGRAYVGTEPIVGSEAESEQLFDRLLEYVGRGGGATG